MPDINAVDHAGITTGYDANGTSLWPGLVVTRGQAASFIGRAIGASATTPPPPTDASPTIDWCSVAQRLVRTLSQADHELLADDEHWHVASSGPTASAPGFLPLQLIRSRRSPLTASWSAGAPRTA